MTNSFYGSEEHVFYKNRIVEEFLYLANKISDKESFLIEDILVDAVRKMLSLNKPSLNHSLMMAINRALTPVCACVKDSEMYPDYISGLMQSIEMAKHVGRR